MGTFFFPKSFLRDMLYLCKQFLFIFLFSDICKKVREFTTLDFGSSAAAIKKQLCLCKLFWSMNMQSRLMGEDWKHCDQKPVSFVDTGWHWLTQCHPRDNKADRIPKCPDSKNLGVLKTAKSGNFKTVNYILKLIFVLIVTDYRRRAESSLAE